MHTLKWFFYCRLQGIVIVGNLNLILDPLQWEIIVNDALIAYVLEFFCDFGCPWVCFEHCTVDRGALLNLLVELGSVLKKILDNVAHTVQLASLWLVCHDVK
jgi:hypothetical protein